MAKNQKSQEETPLTEQESAPATVPVDPKVAELERQLAEAELDKENALAMLEKATRVTPPPPVVEAIQPPAAPSLPRNMRVERSGNVSAQYSTRWPQIRGGTCEFCGTLDGNVPAQFQYKLCPHFRGMSARCTYCPENKDPDEITYHSNMNVATHPDNPSVVIMWCDSYACSDAHLKRFNKANS